MKPYPIESGFPVNGFSQVTPFSDQEEGTSPDMNNCLPFGSDGRLRGAKRFGLSKFHATAVNAGNRIQCLQNVSATLVEPVLGDADVLIKGTTSGTTGVSLLNSSTGAETVLTSSGTYFGGIFGPNNYVFVVYASGSNVVLTAYARTGGTASFSTPMFTDSNTPTEKKLLGMTADEDTVFVWYSEIDNIGEGIMRFDFTGANKDSDTKGVFIRAEADATSIEKVFGGVANAGWDVLPTTAHHGMKLYQGKLAIVGAPLKDGGTATEHELVLYVVDLKTGIIDAVHDLGLDGTNSSTDKGIVRDIEFGLDGFIYVLMRDDGTDDTNYLRKVDSAGNGIWEIQMDSTCTPMSISWNPKRSMLAICGSTLFEDASISLALIDVDSKGLVEYASPMSGNEVCVRCDKDGDYYLWENTGAGSVIQFDSDFATTNWTTATNTNGQNRVCINQFWNSGADEQGATRYQTALAVSQGNIYRIASGGAAVTPAIVTNGTSKLSSSADLIFATNFGILTFFSDGVNAAYYDTSENTAYTWTSDVVYGILPNDSSGGFPYIEFWNNRIVIFGLSDDPSNWYMSAENNPFDWKQQANVVGASISGRTSPAGLFPGRIFGVIPYNDDLVVFGGDHTLYQLSLDPAVDGEFNLISDTIGMAPGRAWCKDGYGAVYFMGNSGGLYRLPLSSSPERISNRAIDAKLAEIDIANSVVHLTWDAIRQGVHVFVRPDDDSAASQFFYDFRTEGWFPYSFGSVDYNPTCTATVDFDNPEDRSILIGCNDGYVRQLDDTAVDDDGTQIDAYYVLGPWVSQSGIGTQVMLNSMDGALARGANAVVSVLTGEDAEHVIQDGFAAFETEFGSEFSNVHYPRVAGRSLAIRIDSIDDEPFGLEWLRGEMVDARVL
jgi:hypothetical protein